MQAITLSLNDLVTGIQETILVQRHGRRDEDPNSYGESRRATYRRVQEGADGRELTLDTRLRFGCVEFVVQMRRLYHHAGAIVRAAIIPGKKITAPRPADVAIVQLGAWFAAQHYATAPSVCRVLVHRMGDEQGARVPIESRAFDFPLMDETAIDAHITKRLDEILAHLDTPAENLPECTDAERFAIKLDPHAKCRTQCRVRDHCAQFAAVRDAGQQAFDDATGMLSGLEVA